MDNPILSICIPTYNRKEVLIPDLKSYLKCKDQRFQIVVQDNASTDGTKEAIAEINDERIIYRRNENNIGGIPNRLICLYDIPSEYSFFIIDKDFLVADELPRFLDYLEKERPDFGFCDLNYDRIVEREPSEYQPGENAIKSLAYLCKHPSGYFYKTQLWDEVTSSEWFKKIPMTHDFSFDVVAGHLAFNHKGAIIHWPLVKNANYRKDITVSKTLSYNDDNFYFAPHKMMETLNYCLESVCHSNASRGLIKLASSQILRICINQIYSYKHILSNEKICTYYGLKQRHFSNKETLHWIFEFNRNYKQRMNILLPTKDILSIQTAIVCRKIASKIYYIFSK